MTDENPTGITTVDEIREREGASKIDIAGIIAQRTTRHIAVGGLQVRATKVAAGELEGEIDALAVPYLQPTDRAIYGMLEQIARDAVVNDVAGAPLLFQHRDPIGVIRSGVSEADGLHITAKISQTSLGRDVILLVQDGAVAKCSIGFIPRAGEILTEIEIIDGVEHTREILTWTEIEVVETSLVPVPAYAGADIQEIRAAVQTGTPVITHKTRDAGATPSAPAEKESDIMSDNIETLLAEVRQVRDAVAASNDADGVAELRNAIEDLTRKVSVSAPTAAPVADHRSPGAFLYDLAVKRDAETVRAYEEMNKRDRAYDGATSADALGDKPSWVGDLTNLVNQPTPLATFFGAKQLPNSGMSVEYAQLDTNTVVVDRQVNEGDDLPLGRVSIKTATAPVYTYGGASRISLQAIERAGNNIDILDVHLRAQAIQAGQAKSAAIRKVYQDQVAAQKGAGTVYGVNKVKAKTTGRTATDFIGLAVDAAVIFANQGLSLDAYIAGPDRFKELVGLTDAAGRPLFIVAGTGTNAVGYANPKALTADLAGLTVLLDPATSANGKDAFASADAIAFYASAASQLQDTNVLNLTKDFSVYFYGATALQIPGGIVPVVEAN